LTISRAWVADGFSEVRGELKEIRDDMATKADLAELREEFKTDMGRLRGDIDIMLDRHIGTFRKDYERPRRTREASRTARAQNSALARICYVPHRRRLVHSMLIIWIILEAAVAVLAILAARKGKPYVYGLAFTFGAYVLYDLARFLRIDVQKSALSTLFLLATISALIAMWGLYKK
jgi:hypothetical protein